MSSCFFRLFLLTLLILLTLLPEIGCVRRRLNIRSNPPGAMAYVNNKPVGKTPISTSFTHYGTMEFRLVKDGYETVTEQRKVSAPWYQRPGIDFFSEVIWPQEITDNRDVNFEMRPERIVPRDELLARAEAVRREAQAQGTFRVNDGTSSSDAVATSGSHAPTPTLPTPGVPLYGGTSEIGSIGAPSSYFNNPMIPSPPVLPSRSSDTAVPPTGSQERIPIINGNSNDIYRTPNNTPFQP
jgi:hypothetical protein